MPDTPVHQAQSITVKETWGEPEPYQGQNGMTLDYKLTLEDGRIAVIKQKPETPAPYPGQHLIADMQLLKEGGTMWRLFGVKRNQGATFDYTNGAQSAQGSSSRASSGSEALDTTQRLIIRQNALNRAVDWTIAMGGLLKDLGAQVDEFEQLIWKAASQNHQQKVLEWAGVPAKREEPTSAPPVDASRSAGSSTEGEHTVPATPSGSEGEAGDKASPATLAHFVVQAADRVGCGPKILEAVIRGQGVESGRVEDLNDDQAESVLAYLEQKAA